MTREERTKLNYDKCHKIIDGVLYKKCAIHNKIFPDENEWMPCTNEFFYINKTNSLDRLQPICKKCAIKKQQERYLKIKEDISNYNKNYYNNHKDDFKENKQRNRKKKPELYSSLESLWRKKNPDKCKEYIIKREMHKKHEVTEFEWERCKQYFNYKCAYCGMTEEEHYEKFKEQLHKEHFYNNGSNDLSNCIPSCKSCNSSKWKYEAEEWYKNCEFFSQGRLNKIYQWLENDYKQYKQIII